jgi:hypothetical protein
MTCSSTGSREQRRQLGRFRLRTMVVVALVVGFGVVTLAVLHYRAHLLWRYEANRLGLQDVQAISDCPMPESPTPSGWIPCRVGCIAFSLPPELASNPVAPKNGASFLTFQHGSRAVVVAMPTAANEFSDLLKAASELCPESQGFTMPRLRRACYQASSDDFRWSMTPDEVRWHAFCITTRKLIRPKSVGHTESLLRRDLDGIIQFGGERAVFDWQSNDRNCGGYMHFIDHNEKIDPTWIRAVCQSLKVSNESRKEAELFSAEGERIGVLPLTTNSKRTEKGANR